MKIEEVEKLKESIKYLSGVGEKTAKRYAFDIIEFESKQLEELITSLQNISNIKKCKICGAYTSEDICNICLDKDRIQEKIIVVTHPKDILKVEDVIPGRYRYFVLGGVIDPLNGVNVEDLKIEKLKELILKNDLKELLLVFPVTNEGEITASYLKKVFSDLNINFSRLAQGVPIGANLEYLDEITLMKSIESAQKY